MKQILTIALGVFIFSSCTTEQTKEVTQFDMYQCDVPSEIADIAPGQDIYWDCAWEASYNNGRIKLITGDDGNLVAIVRSKPDLNNLDSDTLTISVTP